MRLTNQSHFVFQKRGVFYFSRRIPTDLQGHYNRPRIVMSLRTKSHRAAETRATTLAAKLDEDWLTLRWRLGDDPFKRFLSSTITEAVIKSAAPLMSEARDIYVNSKKVGRSITFVQTATRAVRYLTEFCGDKPIDTYTRQEVNRLRDGLFDRGLSRASVKRNLNVLRAIINFTTREYGLGDVKSFSSLYLGEDQEDKCQKRNAIPIEDIRRVQAECRKLDDEARWIISLISDTGMRLSEAVGLVKSDLVLDSDHPHIVLKPHPWRRLKTKGSERLGAMRECW